MAEFLGAVETTVPPDDCQIFVVSGDPDPADVPVLDGLDGRFAGFARDVLVLVSGSDLLHEAAVRLESWSAEPPVPDGEWDEAQQGRLYLSEKEIAVQALWETDLSDRLSLTSTGWHQVRVCVGGRQALRSWADRWDGEGEDPVGLERFAVQVWPVDRAVDPS